ncbi:MAG: sigma 54-interacting transcriptional regulator [Kofleriaceae bacterium]
MRSTVDAWTVFLDEVGELPPSVQVKLLRVLEARVVLPVGGRTPRAIDVRFVAATNRDLEAEADAGRFRRDLYYRLAGFVLVVPPLRDRRSEIEPLAQTFATAAAGKLQRPTPRIHPDALARLQAHPWPGNVRELRNWIERAVLLASGAPAILVEHLPSTVARSEPVPDRRIATAGDWWLPGAVDREHARIIAALEQADGNQTRAAELLQISRRTLLNRLDALAMPRPRKKP